MKPIFLAAALFALAPAAFAQSGPETAPSLPQDSHEGLTVSADAYTNSARAKEKLGKGNSVPVGILPVEVFFKNATNIPVKLDMDTIQLEVRSGSHHQDIDWLDPEEVANAVAHPNGPSNPHTRRLPLGVNIPKDDKRDKILEGLKPLILDSDIIPPNGTVHGFLFFDVGRGDMPSRSDCSIYVPDLTMATTNKPLMFFEVMLGKPATAQQ
jgi:hypothetical protein